MHMASNNKNYVLPPAQCILDFNSITYQIFCKNIFHSHNKLEGQKQSNVQSYCKEKNNINNREHNSNLVIISIHYANYDRCITLITFSNHPIPIIKCNYTIYTQTIISHNTILYNIPEEWWLASNSVFVRKVM